MQKKKFCFYILLVLGAGVFFILDCFFPIKISISESNVIGTVISFLTIIFSLWFSYLLVIKQIYSNRYSSKLVGKYIYEGKNELTIYFFVLLVLGFLLMVFANDYIFSSIWFVVNCIIFVFLCGKNLYKKINEEEVRKAIKDKINIILDEIEKNNDVQKIRGELAKLVNIYDDAYLKNEITTCTSILLGYYEFFEKYIESRNKNIIEDDERTKEVLEILVSFYKRFFRDDISSLASKLNQRILAELHDLAKISIKCEIGNLLVDLLELYHVFLNHDRKTDELYEDVYRYIYDLEICAINLDKEGLFDKILEETKYIFYSSKFEVENGNCFAFFRNYIFILLTCLEENKDKYYKKVYKDLKDIILMEISIDNCDNICALLSMILGRDAFKNSAQAKMDFLDLIKSLANNKTLYDNRFFSFIRYVVDSYEKMGENKRAFDLQYLYAEKIVAQMTSAPNYIFPEFSDKVEENLDSEDKNLELSEKLKRLLSKAIDKNQISWIGLFLSEGIECLKRTQQKDKNIQLIWIGLFQLAATRASSTNNHTIQELVIRYYRTAIFEMDKLKIISKGLGEKLVENLRWLCECRYRENVDFTCEIVELLDDLLDSKNNLYFINNNREIKEKVYSSLFHVAIDSIEKNQDLVIKRVSNAIGWRIKEVIENGQAEYVDKLLGYAIKMYNLS